MLKWPQTRYPDIFLSPRKEWNIGKHHGNFPTASPLPVIPGVSGQVETFILQYPLIN